MEELVVITPELKPGTGGLADYTLFLLGNLGTIENLRLLIPSRGFNDASASEYRVEELARHRAAIFRQLPQSGGKVLLQYSAYGFDRLGFPRALLQALVDWKQKTGGRLVVMLHEIWAFRPIISKHFVVQWLHRRALKRLVESSDVVFTSTASQLDHLRALSASAPLRVLPVGSNIRPSSVDRSSRTPGWTVVFGLQQNRLRTLQRMRQDLQALAGSGQITKIISIGANADPRLDEEERELLASLPLREGFEQRGRTSEEEISATLATASFGLFGQSELSYAKSGTFMAYAAHQLNILAEFADVSKPEPVCWLVAPRELHRGLSEEELKHRAERLRLWQEQASSWPVIATSFAAALDPDEFGKADS
jgi:hypothetical protein